MVDEERYLLHVPIYLTFILVCTSLFHAEQKSWRGVYQILERYYE